MSWQGPSLRPRDARDIPGTWDARRVDVWSSRPGEDPPSAATRVTRGETMVGCSGSACTTREDLGTRVTHGGCGCLPTRSLRSKRPPDALTRGWALVVHDHSRNLDLLAGLAR